MVDEELIKQKYYQFQIVQQQIEQISQHLEMLNQQSAELEISISALQKLRETETGNELLAPIAEGIFFKAKLEDNIKMIVNVGSGVTVERTIPEVINLLKQQKKEVNQRIFDADALVQEMSNQAMKIYQEVENLQK